MSEQPRTSSATAVVRVRDALERCPVVVVDVDGVVRTFDGPDEELEQRIGVAAGSWAAALFDRPHIHAAVTGQITFARWCDLISDELIAAGGDPDAVATALAEWVADRGTLVPETVELIEEYQAQGREVFLFSNGTDHLPIELCQVGIGHLVERTLNSAVFGVAKPDQEAFAAAHAAIEATLGRAVARRDVGFTDDRPANVDGAREFGWRAVLFDRS